MKNIIESLDISKTFTLNMEEIDYVNRISSRYER